MQMMGNLFGSCPSLLDDLVFYPMWQGLQCVDFLSGNILSNTEVTNGTSPCGEVTGTFTPSSTLGFSSSGAVVMGNSSYTIAAWVYLSSDAYFGIISKQSGTNMREFNVDYLNTTKAFRFQTNWSGQSTGWITASSTSFGTPLPNAWHLAVAQLDSPNRKISIIVDNVSRDDVAYNYAQYAATSPINLGSGTGMIWQTPMWRRLLSAGEIRRFWNNGIGIGISHTLGGQ
jgi:hypothetical protein